MDYRTLLTLIITGSVIIPLILSTTSHSLKQASSGNNTCQLEAVDYVRLTVLVDNYEGVSGCRTAWGLSILVETPYNTILFDAGPSPEVLEYNAKVLGVNLSSIDMIVISHEHGDHVRGLEYIAKLCRGKGIKVYVPEAMYSRVKRWIESLGFQVVNVNSTVKIARGVAVIGELYGPPYEQALAIHVRGLGLVILVGCSHPGVVNIVMRAIEDLKIKPYMVLGGFHMSGCPYDEAREVVDELIRLGVKKIAPIHCSGDKVRTILKKEFEEYYLEAYVGKRIDLYLDP